MWSDLEAKILQTAEMCIWYLVFVEQAVLNWLLQICILTFFFFFFFLDILPMEAHFSLHVMEEWSESKVKYKFSWSVVPLSAFSLYTQ